MKRGMPFEIGLVASHQDSMYMQVIHCLHLLLQIDLPSNCIGTSFRKGTNLALCVGICSTVMATFSSKIGEALVICAPIPLF